jgi:uncharacterized membrane protein
MTFGKEEQSSASDAQDARVRRVELVISRLLRIGVVTSLLIVTWGTVISFVRHPDYTSVPSELQRLTRPGAAFPHTLGDVWRGLKQGRGQAIVTAGLLLLIATPVLRVAVSILGFVYERDRTFVAITATVLMLLLLSFLLGKAGG